MAAGWALPGISVYAVAQPRFVTMTVTEVSRPGARGMRPFCCYEVRFTRILSGGGSLCLGDRRAYGLEGETLEMMGRGNALATRVTAIMAIREP